MASRPSFQQPATVWTRARLAWDAFNGRRAPPLGRDPIAEASPESPGAKPDLDKYTRAYGGFAVDSRWLDALALNDDRILNREGGGDLAAWDAVLDDSEAMSSFQQRRLAVVSRPWEVEAGDDSAEAKAAADHLRDQLKQLPWDRICDKMLFGLWYGYGVGEAIFAIGDDGKYKLTNIIVPDRKWFAFTNSGELRMRSIETPEGEIVPPNKFWAYRCGASHDFAPYGVGLAHWCYWPVYFKRNIVQFWTVYLEKFGMPTTLGKYPSGGGDQVRDNILEAAKAASGDRAVAIPDNTTIEQLAAGRQSNDSYAQFCDQMDDYLRRVILGQTGTSKSEAQGLGGSQSEVMKDVRDELVSADSDLLHESFNQTISKWLTEWNFGPGVAPPRVYRNLEDQEDLNSIVERDGKLKAMGWVRTEESAKEVYGEGYERAEPIAPPPLEGQRPAGGNVVDLAAARAARRQEFAAMEPAPLYVSRKLLPDSARAVLAWARGQGIPGLEPASELHVTVLYSKAAVDWFDMAGDDWGNDSTFIVPPGGPRIVAKLGDKGAVVLQFASRRLQWRHEEMIERGASHDFEDYKPHVTVAYAPDFDITGVEPFNGELRFGPEIFEPIKDDQPDAAWLQDLAASAAFSVAELDRIDAWAAELAKETDPAVAEFIASLRPAVRGIESADQLRVVLLEALERFPAERIGEAAGLPLVAARASAAAGV